MITNAQEVAQQCGLADDSIGFQVGDVASLPFHDAMFDGIICRLVLDLHRIPVSRSLNWARTETGRATDPPHARRAFGSQGALVETIPTGV